MQVVAALQMQAAIQAAQSVVRTRLLQSALIGEFRSEQVTIGITGGEEKTSTSSRTAPSPPVDPIVIGRFSSLVQLSPISQCLQIGRETRDPKVHRRDSIHPV